MFCSNCGSKLPEGARFCSVCGAKVLEAVRVDSTDSAPLDFSDLPGADAESKPAEAPVKTRVTFDWSNVIDEPQRKTVQDIKSPWSTTGSVDEKKISEEIKPSTDRSRTMSFIDVLKAEKEQAEAVKSIEETLAEDSKNEERPIVYTEVLDPGYLDGFGEEESQPKPPELHIAPLYEDLDQPVVTPFDDIEEEEEPVAEEPASEFEIPASEVELPASEEPAEEEAAEEEPEFEEPEVEEPAEEPAAEELESKQWFELPDFLKPRENETPFAPAPVIAEEPEVEEPEAEAPEFETPEFGEAEIDEPAVEPELEEMDVEEPAAEEPAVEDQYLEEPDAEADIEDFLVEPEFEEPEFEDLEAEEPEFEEPEIEEPEIEEPEEEPEAEEPEAEEPEAPEFEEPEFDYLAEEEPAEEEPEAEEPEAEEPAEEEDFAEIFDNTEDEYLDISTERGTVTRSTLSFDPEEYDDEDDDEDEDEDEEEDEAEDFEEAPAEEEPEAEEPEAEEPEAEEPAVDEASLFAEIEEEAPKKTGMTIAAPADKESEIEALKKRLAELMGTDWEEPQAIEKEDKLDLDDLVEEPAEQDYYFKDPEPAEEHVSHEPEYEEYDKADLTQYETPAEEAAYEDDYLNLTDEDFHAEEPAAEEPVVEEPAAEEFEIPEIEAEEPVVEEPAVEEPKGNSIDDYLAAILEQEAAPAVKASGLTAEEPVFEPIGEEPVVEEPAEIELPSFEAEAPAVEEPVVEEPVVEEPEVEIELPSFEEEELPDVDVSLPDFEEEIPAAEEPVVEEPEVEIELPSFEAEEPVIEPIVEEPAAEEPAPEVKTSDALTIEELEKDIFGEQPSEDARAEETKKIDKFYTLYRKNEEFQRLLDEEYNKLKAAGGPAPEQVLPDPEPPASAAKAGKMIEDATIYQDFEIPAEALAEAEAKAAEARENAPVKFEKDVSADVKGAAVAAVAGAGAAVAGAAAKAKDNDAPEVEYEEVDKGGGCLTVIAVIIAILLVILLAIILLLNFAPDSAIAIKIDSFIENITSHFTTVEVMGKQILL